MKEIFKRVSVRQGLRLACELQGEYKWGELCKMIDIPISRGNSRQSDINAISELCELEARVVNGVNRFKVIRVYETINNTINHLCGIMDLEPLNNRFVAKSKEAFRCRCKYHHGTVKETTLEKLKRGYRPFKCCCYKINKIQASIYLYVQKEYGGAELIVADDRVEIVTPELKTKIIFISSISDKDKDDDKNVYMVSQTELRGGLHFRKNNVIGYTPTIWQFDARKDIYEEVNDYISFDYSRDNWLQSIELLKEYRVDREYAKYVKRKKEPKPMKDKGAGNSTEIASQPESSNRTEAKPQTQRVQPPPEPFVPLPEFPRPSTPQVIENNNLAHILILNQRKEIIGEFDGFNQVVNQMKTGEFLGFACIIT